MLNCKESFRTLNIYTGKLYKEVVGYDLYQDMKATYPEKTEKELNCEMIKVISEYLQEVRS